MEKSPNIATNKQEAGNSKTYKIERSEVEIAGRKADLFKVGFGTPAQNDQIVRDAEETLEAIFDQTEDDLGPIIRQDGALALINGAASLQAVIVVANALIPRYGTIAWLDPRMGYVVSVSHDPTTPVGMVIPV